MLFCVACSKLLFQRLNILPVTTDIAFTTGFKATDQIVFGGGISYRLGWGDNWNHISFSHQGVGFRSYVDMKLKGSIWISGGLEYNYMQEFKFKNRFKTPGR